MIKCKECGREFKTPQSLGGHMRGSHPKGTQQDTGANNGPGNPEGSGQPVAEIETLAGQTTPAPEEASQAVVTKEAHAGETAPAPEEPSQAVAVKQAPARETVPAPEEPSQAEQIRNLIEQGYTAKQMIGLLGFSETTVRQEITKLVKPEGDPIDEKTKYHDGVWPVIRKMGGGVEAIAPEAVLQKYMGGTPEEELELRAIMKFRAAMLMVMDLVNIQKGDAEADAKRMIPILSLMKETREEQDAAAARAKASSEEIADRAAYETANQLSQVISQNNTRITDSINQIRQAMGGKEDNNPLAQVLNSMQSMQQMMQMFGVVMPGMQGMPGQMPGTPQETQYHPIKKHKLEESEEKNV
jgi:hypothetical protein